MVYLCNLMRLHCYFHLKRYVLCKCPELEEETMVGLVIYGIALKTELGIA